MTEDKWGRGGILWKSNWRWIRVGLDGFCPHVLNSRAFIIVLRVSGSGVHNEARKHTGSQLKTRPLHSQGGILTKRDTELRESSNQETHQGPRDNTHKRHLSRYFRKTTYTEKVAGTFLFGKVDAFHGKAYFSHPL